MNYTNREVVRRLKQYDMFLNSLKVANDDVQRERICDQLDKIEKQILLETNAEYEHDYMELLSEETSFFADEKKRLHKLITLINDRKEYLEDRKNRHREVTGSLVELTTFPGEDKLVALQNRLDIIEKYEENKIRQENIVKDMKNLDIKLSEASRIVKANTRLNDILENKMKDIFSKALDKLNLYVLTGKRDEILKAYESSEYAFKLAKGNLKAAKSLGDEAVILECDEMLSHVGSEYSKYSENVNILKLIDMYDITVTSYDELLEKREKMNDILRSISDSALYREVADEINKQYNTIKLEKQDIEHYESLKEERELRNKTLYSLEEENNSKEFKAVIDELLKNENKIRDERARQAKKVEYQERQKRLLEEQKIEASRVRRQKLIEEARLKEQQERLEKVKELQEKTVINPKKEEKVNIVKEEKIRTVKKDVVEENKEEKINNPLKDKSLDEMLKFSDDFDTDELFENTKIVPNKVLNGEKSLFDKAKDEKVFVGNSILTTAEEEGELPVWGEPSETLFKEEDVKVDDVVVKEPVVEEKVEVKEDAVVPEEAPVEEKKPSIYDILENNKNIIWKTTETNVNKNTIPVIGNNNLKPEVIDNKVVNTTSNNMEFPKIESGKDGEILWKETL